MSREDKGKVPLRGKEKKYSAVGKKEDFLQKIIDNMFDLVSLTDMEGNFKFVGPSHKILGYELDTFIGRNIMDFLHPDDLPRISASFKEGLAYYNQECCRKAEYRYRCADGSYLWLETVGEVILDEENNPQEIIFSTRDVTERKKMEKSLEEGESFIKSILDGLPIGIAVISIDSKVKFQYINENFAKFYRITKEDLLTANSFWEAVYQDPEDREAVRKRVLEDCASGDPLRMSWEDIPVKRKGQETFYITAKNIPLADRTEMISTVWDVTDRKRAEEVLKYQLKFEKMVSQVSSYFVRLPSSQVDQGINYALKRIGEFFQVDRSYVFQFLEDRIRNTHEWCAEGIEPLIDNKKDYKLAQLPWFEENIRQKEYIYIPDVNNLPPKGEKDKIEFSCQGIKTLLCIPMIRDGNLFGFLGFDTVKKKRFWAEDQIMLLKVLAELISNAQAKHMAEEKIRYLSFHDQLTGLYNRAYLEEEMKRLDTKRQLPISIIMADLNGLKLVNDTYGHHTGDEMLKTTGIILKNACRREDIIARWGGDEFVILLPRTSKERARAICKRIREELRKAFVEDVPISMSSGTASKDNGGKDLKEFLREAEDNMYKHKLTESRSGKSGVLKALLKTLEAKSYETEAHTRRMHNMAMKIGERIGISDAELSRLGLVITLHDIGKIVVPEEILTKKEDLTEEEWQVMKKHPETGYRIARSTDEFSHVAEDILAHHERWDGTGYPRGLKGEEIPLLARITAIADAYEVISNGRPYKKARPPEEVAAEIKRCAGTQFDPHLAEVFLSLLRDK